MSHASPIEVPEIPIPKVDPFGPSPRIEHDGYLVMALPDSDLEGLRCFHFVVKRTCAFEPEGRAEPVDRQARLNTADLHYEDADPYSADLRQETELGPPRGGTDIGISGHVYAPGGEATHCYPAVQVDSHRAEILAIGDRFAAVDTAGKAHISRPLPFAVRPLRYALAYGGVDHQHPLAPLVCRSNPLGVGFLVGPAEGDPPREMWTPMPNFEDAKRPLDRDTLVIPLQKELPLRPPAGFGWIPKHWEPRASLAGMPESTKPYWIMAHGEHDPEGRHFRAMTPGFHRGANPALQLPHLKGTEAITLKHMHPEQEEIRFRLPGLSPRLRISINGASLVPVSLELSTVHVEADLGEVQLTWRGTVMRPDSLESLDALKRLEYEVDGVPTLPAPLIGTGFPIELMSGELPPGLLDLSPLERLRGIE